MELKRYVLTEDNLIHDTIDNLLKTIKEDGRQPYYKGYAIKPYKKSFYLFNVQRDGILSNYPKDLVIGSRSDLGKIKKTSDNILDLVEVGDLVSGRIDSLKDDILCAVMVQSIDEKNKTFSSTVWYYSVVYTFNEVKNIWKLQPNGDYKRYEVKE